MKGVVNGFRERKLGFMVLKEEKGGLDEGFVAMGGIDVGILDF